MMKIVINTRSFNRSKNKSFADECLKRIIEAHPKDDFILITDKELTGGSFPKNSAILPVEKELKNPLMAQLWYNYKLPALAKKNKADLIINMDGICSFRTRIPQLAIIESLLFLHQSKFILKKQLQFYKKMIPLSLRKAKKIIAISQFVKKDIIASYKIDENKIDVVHYAADEKVQPVSYTEKEIIKQRYADGREFFLFASGTYVNENFLALLKAFSLFKKRQKSNMKLLLAIDNIPGNSKFNVIIESYKYRSDIVFLKNLSKEELIKITAAAYAFIYPSCLHEDSIFLLNAMKANVPVVVSDYPFFREICADAVLYIDAEKQEDIAAKMMFVFKDEDERNELILKGGLIKQYSWQQVLTVLQNAILQSVQP
jgi:glycosyltransferase involved in cell wall biosynthesis